jgi:hypothetical protein
MSNYYNNYNQYLNSIRCCNISNQGKVGPQGYSGNSNTGPTGPTGYSGLSITGPTGYSKRGPTGPTGTINGELLGTTGPYNTYLLSEKFIPVPEYLKIFINNKFYWIPIINENPIIEYLNSPSWFFSDNSLNYSYNLSNGEIQLKWNEVEGASYYKIFLYDEEGGNRNGIINNNIGGTQDKYGLYSFTEIYSGPDLSTNINLIQVYNNLYLYAYDKYGNRSKTPPTQLFIRYQGDITYEIWSSTIFSFDNGASNYQEWFDLSLTTTTTIYLPYFDTSYGPFTLDYVTNNVTNFPNQPPISYISSITLT